MVRFSKIWVLWKAENEIYHNQQSEKIVFLIFSWFNQIRRNFLVSVIFFIFWGGRGVKGSNFWSKNCFLTFWWFEQIQRNFWVLTIFFIFWGGRGSIFWSKFFFLIFSRFNQIWRNFWVLVIFFIFWGEGGQGVKFFVNFFSYFLMIQPNSKEFLNFYQFFIFFRGG